MQAVDSKICVCICGVVPDEAVGAGGGCRLFGGWGERAFILFTQGVYGGVVIWGGGSTALRGGLSAHWFQAGTIEQHGQE